MIKLTAFIVLTKGKATVRRWSAILHLYYHEQQKGWLIETWERGLKPVAGDGKDYRCVPDSIRGSSMRWGKLWRRRKQAALRENQLHQLLIGKGFGR